MTKKAFLSFCESSFGTKPDYPFEKDFVTTALRHTDTRKWYALLMKVSRRTFGIDSDEMVDIVNLKLPIEMYGSFGRENGVYPAYHMNKLHWISIILSDAAEETIEFLTNVSFKATKNKSRGRKGINA